MSRSIALGLALLVGALVVFLCFGRARRGSGALPPVAEVATANALGKESRAPELVDAAAPEIPDTEAEATSRTELPDDAPSLSGRVVVDGGIPAGVEATVVVLGLGAKRRAPVAPDGSFEVRLPEETGAIHLGLESTLLYPESVVEANPGERDVVLRARLYGGIEGKIVPVSRPSSWKELELTVTLAPVDVERLQAEKDPLIDAVVDSPWGLTASLRNGGVSVREARFFPADDGRFRKMPLPTGVGLVLRVENPHGPPWSRLLEPLLPGEVRRVEVALDLGVTISGRVLDEHGQGVAGARVLCESEATLPRGPSRPSDGSEVATDGEGVFELTRLAPGAWRVSVEDSRLAREAQVVIDTTAGDVTGLTLSVARGGCIRGSVTWADGKPVTSFDVWATGLQKGRAGQAGDGAFEVSGLLDGAYRIEVHTKGGLLAGSASVDGVRPGDAPIQLVLTESPAFRVTGSVVDEHGAPIPDAWIGTGLRYIEGGRDGTFELSGLTEGVLWLSADAPAHLGVRQRIVVGPATEPLRIVLSPGGRIAGKVVDDSDAPVAHASVEDEDSAGRAHSVTDAEGRFVYETKSPRTRLMALREGYAPSPVLELEVGSGKRLDGVVLHLGAACRVSGRVVDAHGNPVRAAGVDLAHLSLTRKGAETDEQGCFSLDDLPEGTFELQAYVMDDTWEGAGATATVELHPDRPATVELRIPEREPVLVRGRITRGGKPVACWIGLHSRSFDNTCRSGGDGRFEVTLQQPGEWKGVLSLPEDEPESIDALDREYRQFELHVLREDNPEFALELESLSLTTLRKFLGR